MRIILSWSAGEGTTAATAALVDDTALESEPLADFSSPSTLSLSWPSRAKRGEAVSPGSRSNRHQQPNAPGR